MSSNTFQFRCQEKTLPSGVRSGVSLHSHTTLSEETMDIIVKHINLVAPLRPLIRSIESRFASRHGHPIDWARAFWTPPLSPARALELEQHQITAKLGLRPLVSITDHDNHEAGWRLQNQPVSTEWTVRYRHAIFHIGVHNLPRPHALALTAEMAAVTREPNAGRMQALLEALGRHPDVLLVLNHPLYDEAEIGPAAHAEVLADFLTRYGSLCHALELNGLRSRAENFKVMRMANELGLPAVSGGDRHGEEPNANLNLTNADTFEEFVTEIRERKQSHVLFMPQYNGVLRVRISRAVADALRENFFGESSRVFYRDEEDVVRPLTAMWWTHSRLAGRPAPQAAG
jgi:hypothetical protein